MDDGAKDPLVGLAQEDPKSRELVAKWIAETFAEQLSGPRGHLLFVEICAAVRYLDGYTEELRRFVQPLITDQNALQEEIARRFKKRLRDRLRSY